MRRSKMRILRRLEKTERLEMTYSQAAQDRAKLLRANYREALIRKDPNLLSPIAEAWYWYDKAEPLSDEKYLCRAVICILSQPENEIC